MDTEEQRNGGPNCHAIASVNNSTKNPVNGSASGPVNSSVSVPVNETQFSAANTPETDIAIFTITKAQTSVPARENNTKDARSVLPQGAIPVLAEFMSTGLLVMLGCMSCIPFGGEAPKLLQVILGFGFTIMLNIQIFGHVSGAHMNPAVTLAAVLMKLTPPLLGILYVLAQCAGGIAGFGLLTLVIPEAASNSSAEGFCNTVLHPDINAFQGLMVELALTSMLIFVCCSFWDHVHKDRTDSLAIKFGLSVVGLSIAGGPFTGASMNPARSLGPALWNNAWRHHWVYWVAPLAAAVIASMLYKFLFQTKVQEEPVDLAEEVPLSVQEKNAGGAA